MRDIREINVSKSIETGRLSCKTDWWDISEICFTCIVFTVWTFVLCLIFIKEKISPIHYVLPFPIVLLIYGIYRKLVEKKLQSIDTKHTATSSKEILLQFAKKYNYNVRRDYNGVMILSRERDISSLFTSTVLLIRKNKIFFTMLRSASKIDPPVFFSHLRFKRKLENYFNQYAESVL